MRFLAVAIAVATLLAGCTGGGAPAKQTAPSPRSNLAARGIADTAGSGKAGGASNSATRGYVITDPHFDPLPGARALYGQIGNAAYEIEVPNAWNGDLVLYAHGFTGSDPVLFVQTPPLREYFISHGFAWAASSFSASGYAPDIGLQDTIALRDAFVSQVGPPARTYIDGTSMGGHVVVSMMEQRPDLVDGGFSECGVVGGESEIDYLMSYVLLGGYVTSHLLLPVTDATTYQTMIHSDVLPALGNASSPTVAGKQFEDLIKNLTGGSRPWRHQGFLDRRGPNFDLPATEDPHNPSLAFRAGTNAGVQYAVDPGLGIDAAMLNAQIIRVPADPGIRNAETHPDYAPRTGQLKAPLLTLHTTGDHFVPISLEQSYRHAVDAAGAGDLLVQRAIRRPNHCQFTQAELQQGFSDLVTWVEQGVHPAGDDLGARDLSDVGKQFTQPLLPGDPGGE
jgi:pimeloyl-ACP methyl ester carboxylesterase